MAAVFDHIERTAAGHFRLNLYAAAFALVHALERIGGEPEGLLAQTLRQHSFLAGYLAEIMPHMPDGLGWDDGRAWWEAEIAAWEASCDPPPPLAQLAGSGALDAASRLVLMVAALAEEDGRFGAVFASLHAPLTARRPSIGLLGALFAGTGNTANPPDGWALCRRLLSQDLIEALETDRPRAEWTLRLPASVWAMLRGEPMAEMLAGFRLMSADSFAPLEALLLEPDTLDRLQRLSSLLAQGEARIVVIRSMPGGQALETMGALAHAAGRSVILAENSAATGGAPTLLGPICTMARAMPVFGYDLAPGETAHPPKPASYSGPIGIVLGEQGGIGGPLADAAISISLPMPAETERRYVWRQALDGRSAEPDALAERFILPQGHIRQAARIAVAQASLDGRTTIGIADVQAACRQLNRQLLDSHAARMDADGGWADLVVNETTRVKLGDLALRCRHRERLLAHLGDGFTGANRGVRALFSGASGTGKTLAAKVLAGELGMDLYRVDLGAVVNKYIGETEKNLHQVLSRAEALDVILLLDEGDSLLGSRTEVKSANDRYANLETNYLLQRLETYQGVVVVTTNAAQNIDRAFQRRMDVVVPFVHPQADERRAIWELHLRATQASDADYLEDIVQRCAFTGGQIRNAALHATLLAVDEGCGAVRQLHLEAAVRSEYRKAGATCPLDNDRPEPARRGMTAFLEVMRT